VVTLFLQYKILSTLRFFMGLNSEKVFYSQVILMTNLLYIHVKLPSLLCILCMVCKGRIVEIMSDFAPHFSLRTSDKTVMNFLELEVTHTCTVLFSYSQ